MEGPPEPKRDLPTLPFASQKDCDKVTELTAQARMRPAGLAEVERARADGRWAAAYP